jgi:hypothetical protein
MSATAATTNNHAMMMMNPAARFQPTNCWILHMLPTELHVNILTYLRAYDLVSIQLTCHMLASPQLTHAIVVHTAEHVYPPELTRGFDTPSVAGTNQVGPLYTYEHLKSMEMLVVARVLSRPEPATGYYVSKSWCKAALQWLQVQQQEQVVKKKLSKKQQRIRNRRLSDASPPWPNVNADLLCEHDKLKQCGSRASRAKRRILDKQAWKVIKKLYPDSNTLDTFEGECIQCRMEEETRKKSQADELERQRQERKRPLSCPVVRGFYTRSRGVPQSSVEQSGKSPLKPGVYHVLPRAWCYKWRRYLKTGEGEEPSAPCASALLCDAHRLPLIPPHLESYLYGGTLQLLGTSLAVEEQPAPAPVASIPVVGLAPNDEETLQVLRAAGLSPGEVASQRMAMLNMERHRAAAAAAAQEVASALVSPTKDQLDRENSVVVEILTQEELVALQKWWPKVHSNLSFGFTVGARGEISWSIPPCRDCDPSSHYCRSDLYVKNRARGWIKKSSDKKRAPASLEY